MRTASGETLAALGANGPLLLVFLRHFGCPLCQEMVADVAARRATMTESGTTVVFVHMHPESQAATFFARYGVQDLQRVSDPDRTLYRAFGVPRVRPTSWLSLGAYRHYLSAIFRAAIVPTWSVGMSVRCRRWCASSTAASIATCGRPASRSGPTSTISWTCPTR